MIDIESLSVRFDGRTVIDGLDMHVGRGERLVIMGKSGCGKSTLLKCLLGFVCPASGVIRVDGAELNSRSCWKLRLRFAYVGQEPFTGMGTAYEFITHPLAFHANLKHRGGLAMIPELMEELGLAEDLLRKDVSALSGGERQRFAVLGAMLLKRDILLLDEPGSALDKASRARLAAFLSKDPAMTIVAVAHDDETASIAGRVFEMGVDI